jgi:type VII secretion integral membrane protein EccD
MSIQSVAGLTRLVIITPNRRLEIAFPHHLPVVSVLPAVLRHGGDNLPDAGLAHEGWVLNRLDGSALDPGQSFAAQQVRDGETLHLVPRRVQWPPTRYDDIVDAIATSARGRGQRWTGEATRVVGLAAGIAGALAALVTAAQTGPPWPLTAGALLAAAIVLLLSGTALSRVVGDATAGAAVAALGMPFAFLGGVVLFAGEPLAQLGAPHLLAGSALLTVAAVSGYAGAVDHARLFVAGVVAGGCGVLGAAIAYGPFDGPACAAVLVTLLLLLGPILPPLAVRLGRIPLPELPQTPADLVKDEPLPDRRVVGLATARADEILTGLLLGTSVTTLVACAMLVWSGRASALFLVATVCVAHLLRARFYLGVRHRAPLLIAGGAGLLMLGIGPADGVMRLTVVLPLLLLLTALAVAAGSFYSRRSPSPRLGRLAEIMDILLTIATVPLACWAVGLLDVMRGIGG